MSVSASMIIDYWRHAPEPHRLLFCGDCATTAGIFPRSSPAARSTAVSCLARRTRQPCCPGYMSACPASRRHALTAIASDYSEVRDSVPRELFNEAVLRFGESAAVLLATFGATCLEVTEFYGYKYGTIPVGLPRGFPIYYDDIPCRDWAALEPWEKVTALADAHGWLRPLLVTFIEKSKALSRDHRKILRNDIVAAFGLAPGPARVSPKREWPASLPGGLTVGTVPFGKFSFADFSRACGFHPAHWDASAVLRDWDQPAHKAVSLYFPHILKAAEAARKRRGAAASATPTLPPPPPPAHPQRTPSRDSPPTGLAPPRRPAPAKPAAAAGNTDTADADADDDVDRPRASRSTRPPKRTKATEASAPKAPPAPADSADEGGESDAPPSPAEEAEAQAPPPKPAKSRKAKTGDPLEIRLARLSDPAHFTAADRDKALQFAETRDLPRRTRPPRMAGGGPPPPFWPAGVPSPFLQHQQQPRYSAASTVTPAGWVVQAPPHFAAPWPSSGTANHGAGMFPGFGARRPTGRAEARPARRRSADRAAPDLILHPRPTVRPQRRGDGGRGGIRRPGDEPAGEDDWAGDWDSDDTSTPQDASPHVDAPSESESAAPVYSGKATRGHAKEKAPLEAPAPKKARGDDKAKGATAQAKATAAEKAAPPAEPPLSAATLPDERITTALAKYGIACMRDLARFSHGLVLRDMGNSELRQAIAAFDQVGDVINRLPGGPTGPLGQLLTDWNALTRPVYKKLRDIAQTSAVLQACLEDDPLFKRLLKRLQDSASQAAHSYGGVATFSYDDDGDVEDPGSGGPTHRGQQRGRAWKQARRQYGTAQPAQPQPTTVSGAEAAAAPSSGPPAQAAAAGRRLSRFHSWRGAGVKLCTYIDDGLFICPSREIAELVSQHLRACAPELGITFSEKSDFTPTQCTEYLGIEIDVRPDRGVFAVTPKKVAKTLARLAGVLDRAPGPRGLTASARDLQKLAGSLIALRMAFPAVRLMTRPLFGLMSTSDALADPFNQSAVTIEGPALDCLRWLQAALQRPERPAHPIWTPRTFFRLFTDASGYGYAAFLDQLESADPTAVRQRPAWSVFGTFPPELRASEGPMRRGETSSNERELRAIVAAADELFPALPVGAHVLIRCDNRSAVAAVARGGGSARLFDLSARLWHRCAALGVSISARHLPARPTSSPTAVPATTPRLPSTTTSPSRTIRGLAATAHGAVVYLTPGKCPASCPVRLLCAYVASTAVQAAPGTPLFPRLSDPAAAITVGFVRRLVKEAAEAIGYDPTDFSGHSLRRGGATAAARRGLPATWIRRHGRWALYSSVPQGYIEDYLFHLSSDLADLGF
eukprot:tig00020952_g16483.t1